MSLIIIDNEKEIENQNRQRDIELEISNLQKTKFFIFNQVIKDFIKFYLFKIFFKISRKFDKESIIKVIFSLNQKNSIFSLINFLGVSNLQYSFLMILVKYIHRIFIHFVEKYSSNMAKYEMSTVSINLILGLLISPMAVYIGKHSNLVFYTFIFYLIKHLFLFSLKRNNLNERISEKAMKDKYYIGVSLGFILLTIFKKDLHNNIKLFKYLKN